MATTKYNGVYKDNNGLFYISTKIKQADGSYKSYCKRGYESAKEAYLALQNREFITNIDKTLTFDNVADAFIKHYASKNKTTSTASAKNKFDKYIAPYFESIKGCNITTITLQQFKDSIINCENINVDSKNKILTLARQFFDYAYYCDYVNEDINRKQKFILENIKSSEIKEKNNDFWTKQQLDNFINSFSDDDAYKILFRVLGYCGFRISELRGLKWSDFNVLTHELIVNKQLSQKGLEKGNILISPKSKNGIRNVKLDDVTYNLLCDFKDNVYTCDDDFIFFGSTPFAPTTVERIKNKHCALISQKQIRLHDFRHSHCSMCIQAYVDNNMTINFLAIAKRLGDDVNTILEVYSHLYPNADEDLTSIL